jgi:hypothetical protein
MRTLTFLIEEVDGMKLLHDFGLEFWAEKQLALP